MTVPESSDRSVPPYAMTDLGPEVSECVDGGFDFCVRVKIPDLGEFWLGCWF